MMSVNAANALDYREARGYSRDYEATAKFLEEHPGGLLVAAPALLDQAWLGLALAERPNTQFLVPCSCLVGVTMEPYLDGTRPDWVLIEKGGRVKGDVELVGQSGKLVLYKAGTGAFSVESRTLFGGSKSVNYPAQASL